MNPISASSDFLNSLLLPQVIHPFTIGRPSKPSEAPPLSVPWPTLKVLPIYRYRAPITEAAAFGNFTSTRTYRVRLVATSSNENTPRDRISSHRHHYSAFHLGVYSSWITVRQPALFLRRQQPNPNFVMLTLPRLPLPGTFNWPSHVGALQAATYSWSPQIITLLDATK